MYQVSKGECAYRIEGLQDPYLGGETVLLTPGDLEDPFDTESMRMAILEVYLSRDCLNDGDELVTPFGRFRCSGLDVCCVGSHLDVITGTVTDATCELVVYRGEDVTRIELRRRWEPVSDEWSLALDSGPGWALERHDVTLAAEQAWAAHDEAQRMSWHK